MKKEDRKEKKTNKSNNSSFGESSVASTKKFEWLESFFERLCIGNKNFARLRAKMAFFRDYNL